MSLYNEGVIMTSIANILSAQFQPKPGDKAANLNKVKELIAKYKDKSLDLIVLPEFFSTGIDHETMVNQPENTDGGKTIAEIAELAKSYNTNIISGSVVEKENNRLYNTSFALNRKGEIVNKYRKIHLFNYFGGTEGERITPGDSPIVVDFDFAKTGLNICFDIRYPMHSRKLLQMGAEIMVCPTAMASPADAAQKEKAATIAVWRALNIARAAENLVYFISSDICGEAGIYQASGHSMIVSPYGEVLQDAQDKEQAVFAQIDIDEVRELKKSYPVVEIE